MRPLIFRNTASTPGRKVYITPKNSAAQYLAYARIVIRKNTPPVTIQSKDRETVFVVVDGLASLDLNGQTYTIRTHDSVYAARGARCVLAAQGPADIVEVSAPAKRTTRSVIVPFDEVQQDPARVLKRPHDPYCRTVYVTVGERIDADRLLVGITLSKPGNWTNWPPHERGKTVEELYAFFGMPKPSFGVQLLYRNPSEVEAYAVGDGDVVVNPHGYHPNVACPANPINYIWAIAAKRIGPDRTLAGAHYQPEFHVAT